MTSDVSVSKLTIDVYRRFSLLFMLSSVSCVCVFSLEDVMLTREATFDSDIKALWEAGSQGVVCSVCFGAPALPRGLRKCIQALGVLDGENW